MAKVKGLPARRAALQMLDGVMRRGQMLEQVQFAALKPIKGAEDKALARALAHEALRWLNDLDVLIDSATAQNLPSDAKVRSVLRLMLVGWLRLGTPPHAVIATGLPLLSGGPRRLAHGVFSSLSKQEVTLPQFPSLSQEIVSRWGQALAQIVRQGIGDPPPLDLTLKDPAKTDYWANQLGASSMMAGHLRLSRGDRIEELPGYDSGEWWVQDLAASLPVRLLLGIGTGAAAPKNGNKSFADGGLGADLPDGSDAQNGRLEHGCHVLDICAAPGGKTMQLAAAGCKVTALDKSRRRLEMLKDNCKRTNFTISPVRADALEWHPKHRFDAILLDAPCTATGTCRRHPDVLARIGQQQITEMTLIQTQLLDRAIGWLNPGGVLVYAVCSLEPDEGLVQARRISLQAMHADSPMQVDPIRAEELPEGLEPTSEGFLATHPGQMADYGGLDGFFIARWRRV